MLKQRLTSKKARPPPASQTCAMSHSGHRNHNFAGLTLASQNAGSQNVSPPPASWFPRQTCATGMSHSRHRNLNFAGITMRPTEPSDMLPRAPHWIRSFRTHPAQHPTFVSMLLSSCLLSGGPMATAGAAICRHFWVLSVEAKYLSFTRNCLFKKPLIIYR